MPGAALATVAWAASCAVLLQSASPAAAAAAEHGGSCGAGTPETIGEDNQPGLGLEFPGSYLETCRYLHDLVITASAALCPPSASFGPLCSCDACTMACTHISQIIQLLPDSVVEYSPPHPTHIPSHTHTTHTPPPPPPGCAPLAWQEASGHAWSGTPHHERAAPTPHCAARPAQGLPGGGGRAVVHALPSQPGSHCTRSLECGHRRLPAGWGCESGRPVRPHAAIARSPNIIPGGAHSNGDCRLVYYDSL